MKKYFLFIFILVSICSFAQQAKLKRQQKPSTDTIYFSAERLAKVFSKKVGDTVGTDKITLAGKKRSGDSVVQFHPKRFPNSVVTINKFTDGHYSARITSKSLFYEWQPEGYFLKKPNQIAEFNGEDFKDNLSSYFAVHKDSVVVFFDFDGQYLTGTTWNYAGDLTLAPSTHNGNTASMDSIIRISQEALSAFPILVTRDSTKYFSVSTQRRKRIIFTPTYAWFGLVAGVSYTNSLYWGDETPSFVFDLFNGANLKAVTAVHEFGHTVGLLHQTVNVTGSGEIGVRNIMWAGNSPTANLLVWTKGINSDWGGFQDDILLFYNQNLDTWPGAKVVGFSLGDAGNYPNHARFIRKDQSITNIIGVNDVDYYRFFIPSTQTVSLTAGVRSEGSNTYASLDVALSLYNDAGTLITSSANTTVLNASISQSLTKGWYVVKVKPDAANPNINNGTLQGHYTFSYTY